jgi:hypothetical protein
MRRTTLQIDIEAPTKYSGEDIAEAINAALDEPPCEWGDWTVGGARVVKRTVMTNWSEPMTKTKKLPRPKRGDYVTVTRMDGRVDHGRVQMPQVAHRVLVTRETTKLSDEGRAKPVSQRSISDLVTTTLFWLVPPSAVTVVEREGVDEDAQMTTMLPVDYARRQGKRMAAGKGVE